MNDTPDAALDIKDSPTLDNFGAALHPGDVVALISDCDSPLSWFMTVEFADQTDRSDIVSAIWFNANGELQRQTFQGKTLVKQDLDEEELEEVPASRSVN